MAGQNEVTQKIRLDGKQYRDEIRNIRSETKSAFGGMRKDLQDAQTSFKGYTDSVKVNGSYLLSQLKSIGSAFAQNLGRGAVGGSVVAGIEGLRAGMKSAVSTSVSFSDALAKLSSRADLSHQKVAKLREEFVKLGKSTGADLGGIAAGANVLYGATGNIDQAMSVMNPISKAAAVSGQSAEDVASFVADRLKGENKEVNPANVHDLLAGVVLAQRSGEFNNLQESMAAFKSLPEGVQSRTGLSNRDLAGLFAGATRAGGNRDTGLAAVQAITHMSQSGFVGDKVLGGLLGVGSFMNHGKFDTSRLTKAAGSVGRLGRNDQERMSMLTQVGGLSEQEAHGLLSILEHVNKFNEGVNKVAGDTKSFDDSMDEASDSLGTNMKRLNNEVVGGFTEIFSSVEQVVNKAARGDIKGAIDALPSALGDMASKVAEHPGLVAGGLAATAAGGFLLKKLGLGGGTASIGAGVAEGKALQGAAGVTPVFVVNYGQIAEASKDSKSIADDFLKKTESLATGGAGAEGAAATMGAGTILAGGAAAAGIGLALGQAAKYIGEGSLEDDVGSLFKKKQESAPASIPLPYGGKDMTVKVEIDSKDPAFKAKAKATDNPRDARGT